MDDLKMERPTYASLSTPPRPAAEPPKRSTAPWILTAILLAFALGLIANPWFERGVRSRLPGFEEPVAPGPDIAAIEALNARIAQLESLHRGEGADPARLSRVEDKVETLGNTRDNTDEKLAEINKGLAGVAAKVDATAERADEALTNANAGVEQAQSLMLVASVRRALDTGARLGALEPVLRAAFPDQPAAVDAVAAVGARPVTLAKLRADFVKLQAASGPSGNGWWDTIRHNMGNIIELRRSDSPAARMPAARPLAAQRLVAGDVAGALAALGASANPAWAAEARRYVAAQRGLALLEAATVAKPVV